MFWLVGLLVLETILEGLVCSGVYSNQALQRKIVCVVASVTLGGTSLLLAADVWKIWLWSLPIVAYRIINLYRVYHARLPQPRLRAVTMQSFGWLVAAQIIVTFLTWPATLFHIGSIVLDVLVMLQLLGALVLLRATLRTWQHATVPPETDNLSDRELPSLSVLVPARNETESLEACLNRLVASDYPKLEILVLDDCSVTRRTPDIIRSFAHAGVRFINGDAPDETRWLAKNYAYERLVQEASGDVLLFCGVDAELEPRAIRRLVTILETRKKNMLSIMPLRRALSADGNSILQAMRYYWELCLPRRFFKRPPVLSTCWLIRRDALKHMGGFESVSRSVSPEATFAREAVVTDSYSFIRGDDTLGVYSNKPSSEQYGTSVRVRYPQLHRRMELVALAALWEITFLLGPIIGLLLIGNLAHKLAYAMVWVLTLLCLFVTYGLAAIGTRLTNPWYGWLLMPVAFMIDLAILHISLWKYEFGTVDWKGRNVCLPVMQIEHTSTK